MNLKSRSISFFLIFALCNAFAQTDIPTKANEYLNAYAKTGRFSGSVLLAKGGNILLRKG
jgi:hypothetical protein